MYNSLKEWINLDCSIIPCISVDSVGDKTFDTPVVTKCYAESKITKVIDVTGTEVISSTILYLNGEEIITSQDEITFNNKTLPVKAISEFYEYGLRSIWVVYL